ncbi:MAG: apolipoprotein N-acyltransferase, partial [Candidatus Marinimicrobia bacterium]|nr:apolipoprotein N-acyltransferase [Candidatus Neomarinimicrobiota bacterium]
MARLQHLPQAAKLFLAGGVMALSFQPFPFGFIAWFGLVPLILAWMGTSEPLRGAYLGFMWALGFLFGLIYWLAFNSGTVWWAATVSMIASVLFLGLNYAFVGWWFVWLRNRWGSAALGMLPLLWTTVEYIRSFGPLGFPWIALANSQAEYLLPIQNAEITGIYGLSFWLVLVNVILVDLIRHRRYPIAIPALLAVFALPWLTGWWLLPREPVPTLRIGIVQPNTNALEKWAPEIRNQHFEQLNRLTRQVAADSPRIVFWPEAATPAYLRRGGASYLRQIQQNLRELQLTVVTGMPEYERTRAGEINYFNAVGLIDSTGIGQQYNKISLVPFGEYIPLSGWITGLKKLNLGQGNFTHGAEYTVFQAGSFPFSTGVCYETTMPHLYRTFVKAGATYLVGLVNDAWFGSTSEPYQHTAQFRYRAVEFRRPVVRSANTGISIVIDQRG